VALSGKRLTLGLAKDAMHVIRRADEHEAPPLDAAAPNGSDCPARRRAIVVGHDSLVWKPQPDQICAHRLGF
jgi:hypothetical protein